ncbi:hypothetical protein D5086_023261, partial [Populus alba]
MVLFFNLFDRRRMILYFRMYIKQVLTDTHPKVQSAGQMAQVGSVIKNPEISSLVPRLLMGLIDPNEYTKYSLDILLQTTFINSIDAPSLALLVLVDPIPEVWSVAARAIGSLTRGMGGENFPDLVPWLLDSLKTDNSNVERFGAAQGLSETKAINLKRNTCYDHEVILPEENTSFWNLQTSFNRYLPRSLGVQFQNYLQQVLPAILDGLADENESVRDAALGAGHVLVEHYATTYAFIVLPCFFVFSWRWIEIYSCSYMSLPRLLPAVEDGIFNDNWRIQQSSGELLGDLLFKVAGTSGKALLEGGNDDEGSGTFSSLFLSCMSLPLLLPAVEDGIFNDNWRIRQSSVELLGDLLFKVAGTSGKALLEGGSDDEGSSTEACGRAIIEVLGRDKRNEILAALYMVRTDVSLFVRQAALHVWKAIVANTPKTLKEIMPVLMNTLISSLASLSSERRQGGCIGLSEVMASAVKSQLLSFMDELIPTIRTALCDSMPEVRESVGLAFSTLYKSAGMQAIDEIVPTLLHALEDDETSDTTLDGLKQILRTTAVLPHILPKLVHLPLSFFNAHALEALAEVAVLGLNFHLGTILPALLSTMGAEDMDVQTLAKEAAETVALVVDEEGVKYLIVELLKGVGDTLALIRRSSSYLIGFFFKYNKLYLVDEAPNMISTLIILLSDSDSSTVEVAWEALSRVIGYVPKEVLPSYIKLVRGAVSMSRDKEQRKKKGGPVVIPGFCLPKALQPLLLIFLQVALGLGELIEVTSEKALKDFVIPVTRPLIRIIGNRFPWQVKSAILSTLSILIRKGGMSLRPFLPQLQTTFIKCLQDSTRTVRASAAFALGKLSALSTRIDPLVSDLLSSLQASDAGVREAILTALKGVHPSLTLLGLLSGTVPRALKISHSSQCCSCSGLGLSVCCSQGVEKMENKILKGSCFHINKKFLELGYSSGATCWLISGLKIVFLNKPVYMKEPQLDDLLELLSNLASSPSWVSRHGSVLTISSLLRHNPSSVVTSQMFPSIIHCLKDALKDEK